MKAYVNFIPDVGANVYVVITLEQSSTNTQVLNSANIIMTPTAGNPPAVPQTYFFIGNIPGGSTEIVKSNRTLVTFPGNGAYDITVNVTYLENGSYLVASHQATYERGGASSTIKTETLAAEYIGKGKVYVRGMMKEYNNTIAPGKYGFVYATNHSAPTVSDNKTVLGLVHQDLAGFDITLDLVPGTYYFRTYAVNEIGVDYGQTLSVVVPTSSQKKTVGRLTKDGELSIEEEVMERTPSVTDGLAYHFPFDGTEYGKSYSQNLLDTSQWKLGSEGSQGNFIANGDNTESSIIEEENPWGYKEPVWASLENDPAENEDGGWSVTGIPIDNTKKYRLSVWLKSLNTGNGITYFGCQPSTVYDLSSNTLNTNPHFTSGYPSAARGTWVLYVAYIHPHDSPLTTNDPTNGLYNTKGERLRTITDFKWSPTATRGGHRAYFTRESWINRQAYIVRPRFEVCDGTEPSIEDLISGNEDRVRPIRNTNTYMGNEGVSIGDATTNLYTNLGVVDGSGTVSIGAWGETYNGNTVVRAIKKAGTPSGHSSYRQCLPVTANNPIAVSFKVKILSGDINSICAHFGGSSVTLNQPKVYLGDGWWQCEHRGATSASSICSGVGFRGDAAVDCLITEVQLEQKSFATPFVQGTRGGNGRIDIPFGLKPPYSINIWHKAKKPLAEVVDHNSSPMIFQMGDYYSQASISFWCYFKQLVVYMMGDSGTAWSSNKAYYVYTDNTWNNQEHMYTLVAEDNRTFKVYMDGIFMGQQVNSLDVTNISYLSMGNVLRPNATYRDLSLYSRALTDQEVRKLYGKSFQLNKNGKLNVDRVSEKGIIPADCVSIPFDFDGTSSNKSISPSSESNTVYEDGTMWIGAPSTNIVSGMDSAYATMTEKGEYQEFVNEGNGWVEYIVSPSSLTAGNKYTGSFVVNNTMDKKLTLKVSLFDQEMIVEIPPHQKQKVVHTLSGNLGAIDSISRPSLRILFMDVNDVILIKNPQIEKGVFASGYSEGARGLGLISYDVGKLLTNNWEEFTFILHAKYSERGVWRLSGAWNRWYFGVNTTNGLTFSWNDNGQKSASSSGVSIPINEWVTIGVTVKNGGGIDIYYNGNRVGGLASGLNLTGTRNIFHLSGISGDSNYPLNAFVKEAIFSSRVLTAQEMKEIHNTKMRTYRNGLQVRSIIKEGQVVNGE